MTSILSFILVFGLVIFFHELGHFTVAKLSGIKVNEFALGMGPTLLKFKGKETQYALRLFPIGGFVSMEGENEQSEDSRGFQSKPALVRFLVVVAGPLMNFVLAILIFMSMYLYAGIETTKIGVLMPDMPAIQAGLEINDRIVAISGEPIDDWSELTKTVSASKGEPLNITIERAGETFDVEIKPQFNAEDDRYLIGIQALKAHSPFKATERAIQTTSNVTVMIVEYIPKLFQKDTFKEEVVGPVGIAVMIGEASKTGLWNVLGLAALISINLGLMNLLPIPALDGGRILFLLIEIVLRKPVKEEWEANIHKVGFILLIGLTIIVFIKDIFKFWP